MKRDKKTLKRILQLLKDIERSGYDGISKTERLSGDLAVYWSRCIDEMSYVLRRIICLESCCDWRFYVES